MHIHVVHFDRMHLNVCACLGKQQCCGAKVCVEAQYGLSTHIMQHGVVPFMNGPALTCSTTRLDWLPCSRWHQVRQLLSCAVAEWNCCQHHPMVVVVGCIAGTSFGIRQATCWQSGPACCALERCPFCLSHLEVSDCFGSCSAVAVCSGVMVPAPQGGCA